VFAGPLTDIDGNVVVADGDYYDESGSASAPSWAYILQGIEVIE
jgi:hypothetical protein